ncbi:MAG: ABC transporter ATP-binding protein [Lentisphaeria bacterium]|nr:ABC transporter ATP-binding protein [Lentisphaeria bacterium]NQZ68488.1 ABC transporter ATP-binding protein [Lentisphaeria bacterium]
MISIKNASIQSGDFKLENISLEIPKGAYGILMGKTGSGKTTILEAVCGLKKLSSGSIFLNDHDVSNLRPGERGIGFLPQDLSLFSTHTVRQHIAFGPRIHKWEKTEILSRVDELAERLGITHLLDRKPPGLSGGERQRVAMGRALAIRPAIICLDEPLSTLDDETHEDVLDLIRTVTEDESVTTLHITHRKSEAQSLGTHFFKLDNGTIS